MIARALRHARTGRGVFEHLTPFSDPPGACQSPKQRHVIRRCSENVLDSVVETVDSAMGRSPSESRGRSAYLAPFTTFATTVLTRAEVTPVTVFASLVYIARARPHLFIALEEWALKRVFLGALIVAAKYTKDSTFKNVQWPLCTGVFGKRDVGRIEPEFLDTLNWELGIREANLLAHHQALAEAAFPSPVRTLKKSVRYLHYPPQPRAVLPRLCILLPRLVLPAHTRALPRACRPEKAEYVDVPMDVEPQHGKRGKFSDLLRSFPIPRADRHARHPIHV
ncbi:Cyclin N-terminal domain-containing protein [Mycena kentingensis (nom. inval.)]|nr:Cyclin N-terminal domain-containing protein [Mycena kentingensis (nom. inval.)]